MKGGLAWFLGGVFLVLAVFLPLSVLQDSGESIVPRKPKKYSRMMMGKCPPFEKPPPAVIGYYECGDTPYKRKKTSIAYSCKLRCPPSMRVRPSKAIHVQCHKHKGRWVVLTKDVHCVATRSVPMVEQQSASPKLLNQLLNHYLNHSHSYLTMAYFFDRADVQLPGFHKYFMGLWEKSLGLAKDLMKYINKRGGYIDMQDLPRPQQAEILDQGLMDGHVGLVAMETALAMEKKTQLLLLFFMERVERSGKQDPHLVQTLERNDMVYTYKLIEELFNHITILRSFEKTDEGDYEIGEYEVDNTLQ